MWECPLVAELPVLDSTPPLGRLSRALSTLEGVTLHQQPGVATPAWTVGSGSGSGLRTPVLGSSLPLTHDGFLYGSGPGAIDQQHAQQWLPGSPISLTSARPGAAASAPEEEEEEEEEPELLLLPRGR